MTTYYVSQSGDNTTGLSLATAKTSIAGGNSLLTPGSGHTLLINDGTYAEALRGAIPSGVVGLPTILRAINRNAVIMRPASGASVLNLATQRYITIDGIDLDGVNCSDAVVEMFVAEPGVHASNIIIQNGIVRNGNSTFGSGINGAFDDSQFINLSVHGNKDNGNPSSNLVHGIYISGSRNLVELCDFYSNAYAGVQIHSTAVTLNGNVVRRNRIRSNVNGSVYIKSNGGTGTLFYNNLIYSNGRGVQVNSQAIKLFNNTLYTNAGSYAFEVETGSGHEIRNNILYLNGIDDISVAGGASATSSSNIKNGTDPKFVDANNGDFRLRSDSPAIDAGTDESFYFTTDFYGNARV